MQLTEFTIKNYRSIDDTGPIPLDTKVTALVGKNESGKTAIMRAMWKSRNVAGVTLDKLNDYPRDRYVRDRTGTQEVTRLKFVLTEVERAALMLALPDSVQVSPGTITLTTFYDGNKRTRSDIACEIDLGASPNGHHALAAIEALVQSVEALPNSETIRAAAESSRAQIVAAEWIWEPATAAAVRSFTAALDHWISTEEWRHGIAAQERHRLNALVTQANQGDPQVKAREWAELNLPSFIYFDQYGQLRTRIHLPSYIAQRANPDPSTRTQTALFEWSGLDPVELQHLGRPRGADETEDDMHRRLEERRALVKSASFALTGDWAQWWEGEGHRLEIDLDGDYLVLQVSDKNNPFPIPFEERSQGFQWFFSFYLVFLVESKKAHKGAILLLDEPGLHLHPTRQMKLIDFFERISANNQLLYSTHLPFLIDGNHLGRVRTVYLSKGIPAKTLMSADTRPRGDRDTLFPLQAALGYSIAQTLFLGRRTLIVEGMIAYWIIMALNELIMAENHGERLHEDTILLPAGGTSHLMPLASVMLAAMQTSRGRMLVLLDSDAAGRTTARRFEASFGKEAPVMMLATPLRRSEATIEDLIPRKYYLEVLSLSGYAVELNDEEWNAPTNVTAVAMAFKRLGLGNFGVAARAAVALTILNAWGKSAGMVPNETRAAARLLIQSINAQFNAGSPS